MAGKRQHYVPQFFQRGFLAGEPGDAERIWLHWQGRHPRLAAIRDVGVGLHFYSKPSLDGTPTLDDDITLAEHNIVASLAAIKELVPGSPVDGQLAARLVTHLTFRTAHVRSSMTLGAMQVLDRVTDFICTTEHMREAMGVDGVVSADGAQGPLEAMLQRVTTAAPGAPPALTKRVAAFFVRENFDKLYEQTMPELQAAIAAIGASVPKTIEGAHNNVLATSGLTQREKVLATLSWQTVSVIGAILPDCIAIVRESSGGYVPLVLSDWDVVDCVILPLAHDRLLVGSKHDTEIPCIDIINRAGAACCDSFFLSSEAGYGQTFAPLIGQRLIQHISSMVQDAAADRAPKASCSLPHSDGTTPQWKGDIRFSISCHGFGTKENAETLGRIIADIVREIGRAAPLSELDGITLAKDYELAIQQLDRGDSTLSAERSRPRPYGQAVGKCVRVIRDGEIKEHLVFDAMVAGLLLDPTTQLHDDSIHLLVSMLAQVAHTTLYEMQLKGKPFAIPNGVLSDLHPSVSSTPCMYYAARESAFALPDAGDRYRVLVLDSLQAAREIIDSARVACGDCNNVNQLLSLACPAVASVLEHAAQWLGHRDGLPDQTPYAGSGLTEDLKAFELDAWLELFGRDLRRIYVSEAEFSPANIVGLGQHVERLLWVFRIFPWPQTNGQMYVNFFREA
ncbi:hypothetical protein DyAD56_20145 [Dyella sp. AD56]|uniref:hypothetical protein n=1 Tax=Dyella sp. AD56 TaxID=1528744 RepID=UPI000C82C436|nr:hypothetical protein [Dyella sp. AD56]PMQ03282.1 hypothetical protein DyAD56_20145 [Dyella sp. AD56]